MNTNHSNQNSRPEPGAHALSETIGRLGDGAGKPPTWSELMTRHNNRDHRRAGWWPDPGSLNWRLLAGITAVALALLGAGFVFTSLLPDDGTNLESVDEVPADTTTTTTPQTTPTSTGVDGEQGLGDGAALGCLAETPLAAEVPSDGWGQADVDGDGATDRIATVEVEGAPHSVIELSSGGWIVSALEPTELSTSLSTSPLFNPPWPLGADLDLDGAEELLAAVQANNFSWVVVHTVADCSVVAVELMNRPQSIDGIPVMASSAACQDACNAALVCLPNGDLQAIESTPTGADPRGEHRWTRVLWHYLDGRLFFDGEETGVLPWERMGEIGPTNTVTCPAEQFTVEGPDFSDEAVEIADLLQVSRLVTTAQEPVSQGLVSVDGEVHQYDTSRYYVLGSTGDALTTAIIGNQWADGPFLDFEGVPIACPAVDGWDDGPVYAPADTTQRQRLFPVRQADGGWAVETSGDEFGDPIPIDGLEDGDWWEVPLWQTDCETGARLRVPSTAGHPLPQTTLPGDYETFMEIIHRDDRTFYFSGGEGFLSVITDDGAVLARDVEAQSWSVSPQGTVVVLTDFEGTLTGIDTTTGEQRWRTPLDTSIGHVLHFPIGDRLVLADDIVGTVAVIDVETGELLVPPTTFDNLTVAFAD